MFPLVVKANMNGKRSCFEVQQQIKRFLDGFCGTPRFLEEISVSLFTGKIEIKFQYYMDSEVPEIKKRLALCDGINQETLKIIETKQVVH